MAFGKRPPSPAAPVLPAAPVTAEVLALSQLPAEERLLAFRETMLRLLRQAGRVAEAVRTEGSVRLGGFPEELDADLTPVLIKGLAEHFVIVDEGTTLHPLYGYVHPDRLDQSDPSAQFQLYELVGRIRELNLFCQQAERDEALGVALQSPGLPARIDRILVGAAFFAGYFENLAASTAQRTGDPARGRQRHDLARQKETLERHKLMAHDLMVAPETLEGFIPNPAWPYHGVEIVRRPESGQQFIHGIYFPAEFARQLAAKERAQKQLAPA